MNLDPRTIIVIIIVGSLMMSGGMYVVTRGYLAQMRAVSHWAGATLVQALGWIVSGALRGVLPDTLSIVAGNFLILLSLLLYLKILAQFVGQPQRLGWAWLMLGTTVALLFVFSAFSPSLAWRAGAISACAGALMLKSAQAVLTGAAPRPPSHRFMGAMLAASAAILAARTLYYLFLSRGEAAYGPSLVNDIGYLSFYIISAMLSFGFVLMCNDAYVAQREAAEQALQEGHARLVKLAAQVPGTIYQYQLFPDGRSCLPYASAGMEAMFEVEPASVREDASVILERVHPDERAALLASIEASARALSTWEYTFRVLLPRQGERWRRGHAQPQRLPDGSVLWHGFITDSTERALAAAHQAALERDVREGYAALARSEQRLRRLINSNIVGIVQFQQDGRVMDANDVLLGMTGHARAALAGAGLDWLALVAPSHRAGVRAALGGIGAGAPLQIELLRHDGAAMPVMLGLSRLEGGEGEWVGFVLDLREQHRIDELKSEFISTVSHELRTPLTSIRGALGLLDAGAAGTLPAAAASLIGIAHKNSQRLVGLVNDILDMEKLASGKMRMRCETLDLAALARQALDANAAYAHELEVSYALEAELAPAWVRADPDRLMQVFANLLSNAAKFSPRGDTVRVRVCAAGPLVRVEIADHGGGIAEEFRARIFGAFAQADGSAGRNASGAGLGLNITRKLLQMMDGEIAFESELGQGSIFWFTLAKAAAPT
ncbi:MAG: ATP-binding protein [Pseudomonadota bacterium]